MSVIDNGIDNVDVTLKFNVPELTWSGLEPGLGGIRMPIALDLLFTGEMESMINGFKNMSKERINVVVVGALVELFGEGIAKGGCYVQD